ETETELTAAGTQRTRMTRHRLEQRFMRFDEKSFKRIRAMSSDTLPLFALTLDASIAACDYTLERLKSADTNLTSAANERWYYWIASIIWSLREAGIGVYSGARRGGTRNIDKGFHVFISRLQQTFPP